jgi:putative transposase
MEIYAVIKMVQRELFGGWGGKRVGAGRKKKPGAGVSHHARPRLASRFPVHVTLKMRAEVFGLRSKRSFRVIERAFYAGNDRFGLRLNHFSVQGDHLHLIVEAADETALARGMQGLEIRIAKGLNQMMGRKGQVFVDRYHAHILRTPTEVKRALHYVLRNYQKHSAERGKTLSSAYRDPYSSLAAATGPPLVVPPRTWLLNGATRSLGLATA